MATKLKITTIDDNNVVNKKIDMVGKLGVNDGEELGKLYDVLNAISGSEFEDKISKEDYVAELRDIVDNDGKVTVTLGFTK